MSTPRLWIRATGESSRTGTLHETEQSCATANGGKRDIRTWMRSLSVASAEVSTHTDDGRVLSTWKETVRL